MAIDAKTIAGLLAGQPPCSVCGLAATRGVATAATSLDGHAAPSTIDVLFCDDCAPAGAVDRDNAVSVRMAKAYLEEAKRSPVPPSPPPVPAPAAVTDPRTRVGHDVRRIARATLGMSGHAVATVPMVFATRLTLFGQRVEARLLVPALAAAVRLAAVFDGGPAPRAATRAELVQVLAGQQAPGGPP